jgi:hypothetical protein
MGEDPASDSGNDPDTTRRLAQERRIAREQRQAEHEKRAGWIAAEDVLEGRGNPNDLFAALASGKVQCLFAHPARWWLKPWTVPQHIWESAQFKNGKLWRNGVCLEGPHQKLIVDERQWGERLGRSAAPAPPGDMPPIVTDTATNLVEPSAEQPSKRAVETPAPAKKRSTKRATPELYAEHQRAHLASTREYASQSDDEAWAQAKGCSVRHVRDVLRQQFYEGLLPSEQVRFRSRGKRRNPDALKR